MSEDVECALAAEPSVQPSARKTARARILPEIRSLARGHTSTALKVLVGIMRSDEATPAVRLSAANAILDRGWGKAAQPVENGEEGAVETIHRVERVIVRPEDAAEGDAGRKA